MKVTNIASLS